MKTQTAKILIALAALMVTGTIARVQYTYTALDDPRTTSALAEWNT
jgi:hypothetical protein